MAESFRSDCTAQASHMLLLLLLAVLHHHHQPGQHKAQGSALQHIHCRLQHQGSKMCFDLGCFDKQCRQVQPCLWLCSFAKGCAMPCSRHRSGQLASDSWRFLAASQLVACCVSKAALLSKCLASFARQLTSCTQSKYLGMRLACLWMIALTNDLHIVVQT